jgi:GDP-D-mannose 3',5'-epimerase
VEEPGMTTSNGKRALVCGAGGFIGSHLVKRLKSEGFWVRGVDLKASEFSPTQADEFVLGDLRDPRLVSKVIDEDLDELYQLAADMGGAGFTLVRGNDAAIMHNSALINLNVVEESSIKGVGKVLFASSACVYPERNQLDPDNPVCSEDSVYPAEPDSEYGWEKLFSERLYMAYVRNRSMEIHIARFHNIFGPEGSWNDGREKAPAAICRKVAETASGGTMEMWGDGEQKRSFLYIDECLEGVRRFMQSDFLGPVNIGSAEMVTINQLAQVAMDVAGKRIEIKHVEGPVGVRARSSDNRLIESELGWKPVRSLREGMVPTYRWIEEQVTSALESPRVRP